MTFETGESKPFTHLTYNPRNCSTVNMELKNLKASFIFSNDLINKENGSIKKEIFKIDNATFTIYKHTPTLLNVTGIKSLDEIKKYKKILEKKYKQSAVKVRIDNTFFSKKDYKNIDLDKIYTHMKKYRGYNVNFNRELFHGMYMIPKPKTYPTILLFRSGSYTLMGGKSLEAIFESEKFVKSIIDEFEKTV